MKKRHLKAIVQLKGVDVDDSHYLSEAAKKEMGYYQTDDERVRYGCSSVHAVAGRFTLRVLIPREAFGLGDWAAFVEKVQAYASSLAEATLDVVVEEGEE